MNDKIVHWLENAPKKKQKGKVAQEAIERLWALVLDVHDHVKLTTPLQSLNLYNLFYSKVLTCYEQSLSFLQKEKLVQRLQLIQQYIELVKAPRSGSPGAGRSPASSPQTQRAPIVLPGDGAPRNEADERRVLGEKPSAADVFNAVFSWSSQFLTGEIVIIPRSTGGFSYAQIEKKTKHQRCFFNAHYKHPTTLIRCLYSKSFKDLPSVCIGKLSDMDQGAEQLDVLSPDVGDVPSYADISSVVFSPKGSFIPDELVAVSRSGGGFSIGRIVGPPRACKCPNHHQAKGYRVLVREADDETSEVWKDVYCILVGKLNEFWATEHRNTLVERQKEIDAQVKQRFGASMTLWTPEDGQQESRHSGKNHNIAFSVAESLLMIDDDDDEMPKPIESPQPGVDVSQFQFWASGTSDGSALDEGAYAPFTSSPFITLGK